MKDVRIPLFKSAIDMIASKPFLGSGISAFEGEFAPFREISYFLRSNHFAVRSPHPHNELLFMTCAMGIPGGLAWLFIVCYPICLGFRFFHDAKPLSKLFLFSTSFLFLHSFFDLGLNVWPTMFLFFISLGILIGDFSNSTKAISLEKLDSPKNVFLPAIKTCAQFASAMILFYLIGISLIYSSEVQKGRKEGIINLYLGNAENAIKSCDFSAPSDIYRSAMLSLFVNEDHVVAKYFLDKLNEIPCKSIGHSNRYMAMALIRSGHRSEALAWLEKEENNYPLSLVGLHKKMTLEKELGMTERAEQSAQKLIYAMKMKNLNPEDLKKVLANPYYDDKFHELNQQNGGK